MFLYMHTGRIYLTNVEDMFDPGPCEWMVFMSGN